jgi:hypothetical protein
MTVLESKPDIVRYLEEQINKIVLELQEKMGIQDGSIAPLTSYQLDEATIHFANLIQDILSWQQKDMKDPFSIYVNSEMRFRYLASSSGFILLISPMVEQYLVRDVLEEFHKRLDIHSNVICPLHKEELSKAIEYMSRTIQEIIEWELEQRLLPFYVTFGTDEGFPYQGGYLVIFATSEADANKKFRRKYPDRSLDCLNYSFLYTEKEWSGLHNHKVGDRYIGVEPHEILF